MKKFKRSREFGYGAAGLTIGVVVFLMLQAEAPVSTETRSSIIEFTGESTSEYVLDEEDYNGVIVVPFLEYGSYQLTSRDYDNYEADGTVDYGKFNPTYFLEKDPAPTQTGESLEEVDEKTKTSEKIEVTKKTETTEVEFTGNTEDTQANQVPDEQPSITPSDKEVSSKKKETSVKVESNEVAEKTDKKPESNIGGQGLEQGFNIETRQLELVDADFIKKEFASNAVFPVAKENWGISSEFGRRIDPYLQTVAYHVGLDVATTTIEGVEIFSVLDGEVLEKVSGDSGLGNYVVIGHKGFETLYAHMNKATELNVGDKVKAGDLVGYVGNTGRSTGPHLHLEVGIGSIKLDPQVFLDEIERND